MIEGYINILQDAPCRMFFRAADAAFFEVSTGHCPHVRYPKFFVAGSQGAFLSGVGGDSRTRGRRREDNTV